MTLLPQDKLDDLILNYPGLTEERRKFIVEFIQATDAGGHKWLDNPDCAPEENAFLRAIFGVEDDTRPLPELQPSEDRHV
jgi:hypothetical protein